MTSCGDLYSLTQAQELYDKLKDTTATTDSTAPQKAAFPTTFGIAYPLSSTSNPSNIFQCPNGTIDLTSLSTMTPSNVLKDGNIMTDALFKKGDTISISLGSIHTVNNLILRDNTPSYSFIKQLEIRFIQQTTYQKTVNFTEHYQSSGPSGGYISIPSGIGSGSFTNTNIIEIEIKDAAGLEVRVGEILICGN